jgi:hypothetical protein
VESGLLDREQIISNPEKENKMSNKRFIIVIGVLTVLVATLAVSYSIIGVEATDSVSKPERVVLPVANEAGMKIYQQSEWADYQRARASMNMEGLAIYQASERNSPSVKSAVSNQVGLAIYHESERNSAFVVPAVSNEEGMAIYLESERYGAEVPPVRLYNGEPFNAYQRSEWLGAEE